MVKTEKREKGDVGEEVAFSYLKDNGYKVLDRNYSNRFGEIDIIALRKAQGRLVKHLVGRQPHHQIHNGFLIHHTRPW